MTSIKQQMYAMLVSQVTGVTWYGSDDNTAKMEPPPLDAPTPWGYLRFTDEFDAIPGDTRAMIQIRVGDVERRQFSRINTILTKCAAVFPRNPAFEIKDSATGEIWYFPEHAGWGPETEDFDRPGMMVRTIEFAFRKRIKPAIVAMI